MCFVPISVQFAKQESCKVTVAMLKALTGCSDTLLHMSLLRGEAVQLRTCLRQRHGIGTHPVWVQPSWGWVTGTWRGWVSWTHHLWVRGSAV